MPTEWLTHVKSINKPLPDNLRLLCGDSDLDLLVEPLTRKAGVMTDVTPHYNPYR